MLPLQPGTMKALYFDCSAGISGDMAVAALLDLTDDRQFLLKELKKLGLKCKITVKKVKKAGQAATKFDVSAEKSAHRGLADIFAIIDNSSLPLAVKFLARRIFFELGNAEAIVHKTPIESIHFHEVGAVDSIVDIVAASILLDRLKVSRIYCSSVADGRGRTRIAHGLVSIPVPAVRQLLKGFPRSIIDIKKELTTPTGAAILKTVCNGFFGSIPGKPSKTGFGAGTRDLPFPNVLKVWLFDLKPGLQEKIIIETNIDDMSPELFPYVIDRLMQAGARDAFVSPCYMKKNRVGFLLSVLCSPDKRDTIIGIIFRETTTLGVRFRTLDRVELERTTSIKRTRYGTVRIKHGFYKGALSTSKPEYEDCRRLAMKNRVPIRAVYDEIAKGLSHL